MKTSKPIKPGAGQYEAVFAELLEQLEVAVQEYWVELLWIVGTAAVWAAFQAFLHVPAVNAAVYVVILWAILIALPRTREYLMDNLLKADVRRRWNRATRDCGLPHLIPLAKLEPVATGYRCRIRVGKGVSFADLEMRREKLAASMGVRDLLFYRDIHNAQVGTLTLVKFDPLAEPIEASSPLHEREQPPRRRPPEGGPFGDPPRWNGGGGRPRDPSPEPPPNENGGEGIWRPVPVGIDEHGEIVTVTLPERNILIGGVPDSGKSVAMSQLLAAAALDPNVHLWLIDWKGVELQEWERCATDVAQSTAEAIALCGKLNQVMKNSYERMRNLQAKKIRPSLHEIPLHMLIIDELSPYTDGPSKTDNNEMTSLLIELLGRGRAAGVMTCAATQKPEASVVPTKLRDLFVYRWAMRCMTPEASDTILGRGWASRGYSAVDVEDEKPGVGFLLTEGKLPRKLRSFYLREAEIRSLGERAFNGRYNHDYSIRR